MRQEEQQVTQTHPETVRSAPVPVSEDQHSNGAPRSGRTGVPEDALDDRGTFDDPTVAGSERGVDGGSRHSTDRDTPEFREPAPVPTAFGATTVGSAVAASAMAGSRPEDERDPRGEETARPGDGAPGRTDRFDDERADPTAGDRLHQGGHPGRHADREGRGEDPTVRVETVRPDQVGATGAAGYGRPTEGMVDPDADDETGRNRTAGTAADGTDRKPTGATGVATATGTAATAAASSTSTNGSDATSNVPADAATLFDSDTAQGFRDRWREVQLRFVDDPKAAAGQAQSLVDEAIQALAAALAAQKEKLGTWQGSDSADTEDLRVAVRQYRDFLDRVLGR
jgi:hypothetical protein